jgi:hypothetical protein
MAQGSAQVVDARRHRSHADPRHRDRTVSGARQEDALVHYELRQFAVAVRPARQGELALQDDRRRREHSPAQSPLGGAGRAAHQRVGQGRAPAPRPALHRADRHPLPERASPAVGSAVVPRQRRTPRHDLHRVPATLFSAQLRWPQHRAVGLFATSDRGQDQGPLSNCRPARLDRHLGADRDRHRRRAARPGDGSVPRDGKAHVP